MKFLETPTRNLFFTGKGGVGKTSMACIAAIALADRGRKVLLVSTDPASNLDEVLGTPLAGRPTEVDAVANLWALNIDPAQAAHDYRERLVAPYRNVLPEAAVTSMEEQLSGSCTVEIAAFDEFARLLGDPEAIGQFDHVVFDTAPTGHTLRLLSLPAAWSGFMETNTSGTSCLGPLAGLQAQQAMYQSTVETLSDAQQTTLVLVTRPEASALREAARTSAELHQRCVDNQHLIVNGTFTASVPDDPVATAMESRCQAALAQMPRRLQQLPRTTVPLQPTSLVGLAALRTTLGDGPQPAAAASLDAAAAVLTGGGDLVSMTRLVDQLASPGRGVILTMGKGGVGKTSIAAAVAVALAERGYEVRLTTTDPAAHLADALAEQRIEGLTVSRIDPAEVTAAYREEVMQTAGGELDAAGRTLLEEDLRSPCTEEIAVFRSFAQAVAEGEDGFVVLDTAPTGHTVLLLDSALAFHREVTRQTNQMPPSVERLLPRLRDPEFTRILIATLPESTPVHEAAQLQTDLRRAEIEPFAWIINQSIRPLPVRDPVLAGRQQAEKPLVDEVVSQHAQQTVLVPWLMNPPTGLGGLRGFLATDHELHSTGSSR